MWTDELNDCCCCLIIDIIENVLQNLWVYSFCDVGLLKLLANLFCLMLDLKLNNFNDLVNLFNIPSMQNMYCN